MKQERQAILIDKNLHNRLKKYCREEGLILKFFIEKLIKEKLSKDGYSISTSESD